MAKPKFKVPGGVIVQPLLMIDSLAYEALNAKSVKLLSLMQRHWREDKAIDYGITQVTKSLKCSRSTASALLTELQDYGFIELVDEADFYANKARSWRLTFKPFLGKEATNDWKYWPP
jgi:hypothetical protein